MMPIGLPKSSTTAATTSNPTTFIHFGIASATLAPSRKPTGNQVDEVEEAAEIRERQEQIAEVSRRLRCRRAGSRAVLRPCRVAGPASAMIPDLPASAGARRRLVTAPSGPMKIGRRAGQSHPSRDEEMPELVDQDQHHDADRERRSEEQRVEPDRDDHRDQRRSESAELDQKEAVLQKGEEAGEDAARGSFAAAPLLARCRWAVLLRTRRTRRWRRRQPGSAVAGGGDGVVRQPLIDRRLIALQAVEADSSVSIMARHAEPAGESLAVRCAVT